MRYSILQSLVTLTEGTKLTNHSEEEEELGIDDRGNRRLIESFLTFQARSVVRPRAVKPLAYKPRALILRRKIEPPGEGSGKRTTASRVAWGESIQLQHVHYISTARRFDSFERVWVISKSS